MTKLWRRVGGKAALVTLLFSGVISGAEVEPSNPQEHGLVKVRLAEGERAWIISERFEPVEVVQCSPQLLVWTGPPGRYAILSWTETQQTQTIVTVRKKSGPEPEPIPPPEPDPPPPPPPPITVLNDFGIGKVAYEEALKVNRPDEARVLGDGARLALNALIEGKVTPAGAEAVLRSKRELLQGNWQGWETKVEQAMTKAISEHGGGALRYRDYFLELAVGLETAGAQAKKVK